LSEELALLAVHAAREAGALLLERFRVPPISVETKSTQTDLVSDADRDAEALISKIILEERPSDGLIAEETGNVDGESGLTWIVDPLDGTVNFLHGLPQWCVSIACEDSRGGVAAALYDACRKELFTATRGGGAFLNGVAIRCSSLREIARAIVATGFAYEPDERRRWGAVIASMLPHVADIRRAGSAALDLAWTACGRMDAYAEIPCRLWDRAAGLLIASEAGCRTAMLPAIGPSGEGVLAAPPALHDQMAAMLREARIPVG